MKTCIIAEAGVNHNGSLKAALRLVAAAADAGADMVKFQTFRASDMISSRAPKAEYQKISTGGEDSQLEMVQNLELNLEAHRVLLEQCSENGIKFLSTPFDKKSVDMLTDTLGLDTIKIASGEITNAPLLLHIGAKRRDIILSTGMSTLGEIEEALSVLSFGLLGLPCAPSHEAFRKAYISEDGRKVLEGKVTLLHCTTEYPAPFEDVNLRAMETMRQAFCLPVGCSDHTKGLAVPVAAVAIGACVVEKHFTLDRNLPGPDHKASLIPSELAEMVRLIREVERSLGSPLKMPGSSEIKNLAIARKSLVAGRDVAKGEIFTEENIACKRPGWGISPMEYWDILGRKATRYFEVDEVLEI